MQAIIKLVLIPAIPYLVKKGLEGLIGSLDDGIAWLKEQAAKTETKIDDQLVSVVEDLVADAGEGQTWEAITSLIKWIYDKVKGGTGDVAVIVVKVIETVAKQLNITL